jgi:hypothetical protein
VVALLMVLVIIESVVTSVMANEVETRVMATAMVKLGVGR